MLFISKNKLEELIRETISSYINNVIVLDPDKSYIFVLPEDINKVESARAFEALRGDLNFLVIHTDKMKVIEVN